MQTPFFKYQSLGNDFVLFDWRNLSAAKLEQYLDDAQWPFMVEHLSRRHFGVGSDGVLVLIAAKEADAECLMFNANGKQAERCLNGLRCSAHYLYHQDQLNRALRIKMGGAVISAQVEHDEVTLVVGQAAIECEGELKIDQENFQGFYVSIGNPHFVISEELDIKQFKKFPNEINIEIVWQNQSATKREKMPVYELHIYERGCGFTLACGTGAAAVTQVLLHTNMIETDEKIKLRMPGGDLLTWIDNSKQIIQLARAEKVFEGKI